MSDNEAFSKCTTDASARFDSPKPQAATVPCIWDSKQQIYVPVYSHRGVEIKDRIEALEAALRKICDGPRDADKSYPELLAELRIEARAALGEKE